MNLLESSINAYKLSCLDYINEYKKYVSAHVKPTGAGVFQVKLEGIERPFKYLSDVLHWGVAIYDTIDKNVILDSDKSYMSGVKFIDNMTKHQADYTAYDLWTFVHPSPEYSTKVNSVEGNNVNVGFQMNLKFIFQDISNITIDPKYANQKQNYINNICGKDVNEIISKMEKIIKKHINLGGMPI